MASKFFKGVGVGASLVAVAGVVGAGYLAAKKVKESDKKVNDLIRDVFRRGKKCECGCEGECTCGAEDKHDDVDCVEENLTIDDLIPAQSFQDMDIKDVSEEDYLESVIQERDALKAELDELKNRRSRSKRKKNQ